MRKKLKLTKTNNMFGYTYTLSNGTDNWVINPVVAKETDFTKKNKSVTHYFWFRSPSISLSSIDNTIDFLADVDDVFKFEVWENDGKFDASLKLSNEDDAQSLAWSLTEDWLKWSQQDEDDLKKKMNAKPQKVKIDKNGNVKVTVTVTTLGE